MAAPARSDALRTSCGLSEDGNRSPCQLIDSDLPYSDQPAPPLSVCLCCTAMPGVGSTARSRSYPPIPCGMCSQRDHSAEVVFARRRHSSVSRKAEMRAIRRRGQSRWDLFPLLEASASTSCLKPSAGVDLGDSFLASERARLKASSKYRSGSRNMLSLRFLGLEIMRCATGVTFRSYVQNSPTR